MAPKTMSAFATAALLLGGAAVGGEASVWEWAGWGGGGYFWCCAWHPASDDTIFLGGDVGGVYKTTDKAKTWKFVNEGLTNYAIHSIAIDKRSPETLYVGTRNGICKSTDVGAHWTFLKETGKGALGMTFDRTGSVRGIAVDPANSDFVCAGTMEGRIFVSKDGGTTWRQAYQLKEKAHIAGVTVSETTPTRIFAATSATPVLMSEDAGETWKELPTPKGAGYVACVSGKPDILYGAFLKEGVHKSTDGGRAWTPAKEGIKAECRVRDIVVSPADPETVHAIGNVGWNGAIYGSTDGGRTWRESRSIRKGPEGDPTLPDEGGGGPGGNCPLSSTTNIAMNPKNSGELFVSANWRNVISLDGGATWEERDRGADITCVTDIRFLGERTYAAAMDEGTCASDDGGRTWRALWPKKYDAASSGHHWRIAVWKKEDAEKILVTNSPWNATPLRNQVLISGDGGRSFRIVKEGLPDYVPQVNCMWGRSYPRALACDPNDANVLYLGMDGDPDPAKNLPGGGVFKSVDGGSTWKRLDNQPGSRRMFYGLAVDPTDSSRVYWGACGNGGGLYRSGDGGGEWKLVFKDETWIFNLAVSKSGVVYCPGKNLWRSADHGETWEKLTSFDDLQIVGLEIDPRDERVIWISRVTWGEDAKGCVMKTSDGGASWEDITAGLPYRKPTVLRFNPATNELWAGGVGLYKRKQ